MAKQRLEREAKKSLRMQNLAQMMDMFSPERVMKQAAMVQELQNSERGSQSNLNNSLVGLLNTAASQGNITNLLNEIIGQQGYQSKVEPMQGMANLFSDTPQISPEAMQVRAALAEYLKRVGKQPVEERTQMKQQETQE